MGQLSKKLRSFEGGVAFWCPGCEELHKVWVGRAVHPVWGYNGNPDAPTFTPSILVRSGHYLPGHTGRCWCDHIRDHPEDADGFTCSVCHTFVTDGRIQFLGDCTHAFAGQTVDLPDLPAQLRD